LNHVGGMGRPLALIAFDLKRSKGQGEKGGAANSKLVLTVLI